jgi:hypothetical protein
MKKSIIAFFLFMSVIGTASAPPYTSLSISAPTAIYFDDGGSYAPLINAMHIHEAGGSDTIVNELEQAYGGLQIRQCRIDHYNILNGTNYTLIDCFDFELSKKVFLYFTCHDSAGKHIPNKSWERAAKDWNGSGKATEIYWENVKQLI